jgi:hypothetical protein
VNKRAFTIIEVLVILALLGMIAAIGIPQINRIFRSNLKNSSRKISSAIRYAYDSSVISGNVFRLVIDFEKSSYHVEQSDRKDFLVEEYTEEEEEKIEDDLTEEEKEKRNKTSFLPIKGELGKPNRLPSAIKFDSLEKVRIKRIFKEGKTFLYFFPQGATEKVILRLVGRREKTGFYSLVVNNITGKVKIEGSYVEEY